MSMAGHTGCGIFHLWESCRCSKLKKRKKERKYLEGRERERIHSSQGWAMVLHVGGSGRDSGTRAIFGCVPMCIDGKLNGMPSLVWVSLQRFNSLCHKAWASKYFGFGTFEFQIKVITKLGGCQIRRWKRFWKGYNCILESRERLQNLAKLICFFKLGRQD